MTTWILAINEARQGHWDVAKEHMFWDMTKRYNIEEGDTVYFWLGGQNRFAGRAEIAGSVVPPPNNFPWNDHGERQYRARIRFSHVSDAHTHEVSWTTVKDRTGITGELNGAPHTDDSAVEDRLATLVRTMDEVEAEFLDDGETSRTVVSGPDTRRELLRPIKERRGQPAFRNALLRAYRGQCAITGSTTVSVLEAAHIHPYRGDHTNIVQNGLLLRSDIHTLFDVHQLTVVTDGDGYRVRVDPGIGEETYRSLDRQPLAATPEGVQQRPGRELLEHHNADCPWLPPHIDLHRSL